MTLEIYWRLPTDGDGRTFDKAGWTRGDYDPSQPQPVFARTGGRQDRYSPFDYLVQVARAAELGGLDGIVIPQTDAGDEPLVVAASLARDVRRIKLIPSLPAPFLSAVYAAKIATSFQRLTAGRLALNLVTAEPGEKPWHGRKRTVAEQIERTGEFLDVFKGFWSQAPFTYEGRFYEVANGGFAGPLAGQPLPEVFLSGASDEAVHLSGRHADVHILQAGPIEAVANEIERVAAAAAVEGRSIRFILEAEIVSRHTAEEAWGYVWRRAEKAEAPVDVDRLAISDTLWRGFDRFRAGPAVGVVGSHEQVAETLHAFAALGVSGFILGANPSLEELYRTAEHLLPRLRSFGRAAA